MTKADATPEERDALIKALAVLASHFEVAQVFVSKHDPIHNKTTALAAGLGNIFARIGHTQDWLNDQQFPDRDDPPSAPPVSGDEWKLN